MDGVGPLSLDARILLYLLTLSLSLYLLLYPSASSSPLPLLLPVKHRFEGEALQGHARRFSGDQEHEATSAPETPLHRRSGTNYFSSLGWWPALRLHVTRAPPSQCPKARGQRSSLLIASHFVIAPHLDSPGPIPGGRGRQ